jgi:phage shock protein C
MRRYGRYRYNRRRGDGIFLGSLFSRNRFDEKSERHIYRSRNGVIFGVCRGFAEYFDFSLFWIRFFAIAVFFVSGIWPIVILYIIAAILMQPEPVIPLESMDEREFYGSYIRSKELATERLKRRYDNLERKIQRLEHTVTASEYDWEKRLNSDPE